VQEWRRRQKPCRFQRFAGPFCCDVARRTIVWPWSANLPSADWPEAAATSGLRLACGLLAPAVPPKPAKNIPNPHTLPTTQPHQVPTPAPSPRAASSWTVSTAPAVFLPPAGARIDAPFFRVSPASLQPITPITNPCRCIQQLAQDAYDRRTQRVGRFGAPLPPILRRPPAHRPAPLDRPFSVTHPSTIGPFHQTSIEQGLPSLPGGLLVHLSRVVLLYPTHPLSPAGPMRISRYHADHLS
jgi:hypothetical protein